jgi:hypothetical protein
MIVSAFSWSTARPSSGMGLSGSGPHAGVCSPSPSSSWECGWDESNIDEEHG